MFQIQFLGSRIRLCIDNAFAGLYDTVEQAEAVINAYRGL